MPGSAQRIRSGWVSRTLARSRAVGDFEVFSAVSSTISAAGLSSRNPLNDAARSMFGYEPEDILGRELTTLMPERFHAAHREGFARYVALQPHYNLVEREYEQELAPLVEREGLSTLPYFGLAKGFLTGKYRSKKAGGDSPRAEPALSYLDERGERVLAALDEVAHARGVGVAAVSLAWLAAQPTVTAPIASARTIEQLTELLPFVGLDLTDDELQLLTSQ